MRGLSFAIGIVGLLGCSSLLAAESATGEPADLESLVAAVASPDPVVAINAIDALGDLESQAKDAVPALIQALGSADEAVRWHAGRTLGAIGPNAEQAVPELLKALNDSSSTVKAYAAFALGAIGDAAEPAVEKLIELAFDNDPLVRRASLRALRSIGAPPEKMQPLFVKMFEEGDPSVVLPTLHSIAEAGEEAVEPMRRALKNEKLSYWACVVLADIGQQAVAAVPELTDVLEHGEPEVRMQALLALAAIGSASGPAVPTITGLLESDEFEAVRFSAAYALGAIGQKDEDATKALVAAARSDKPILKAVSLWVLAEQNPENLEVVRHAATTLAAGLTSEDAELRTVAAKLLGQFDEHPEIVGPALVAALRDSDPRVIEHALDAMAALGPKILPKATAALQDKERRHFAAALIYRLGPQAAPAVPTIVELLSEPPANEEDLLFRHRAQLALAAIGPEAVAAVPVLIESLASEDEQVRASACYALGKIGVGAADAVLALEKRLEEPNGASCTAVVWALLQICPDDEQLCAKAVPMLVEATKHEEELVRVEAATALGQIAAAAKPEIIELLKELAVQDDSTRVREAATEAVKRLGPQ